RVQQEGHVGVAAGDDQVGLVARAERGGGDGGGAGDAAGGDVVRRVPDVADAELHAPGEGARGGRALVHQHAGRVVVEAVAVEVVGGGPVGGHQVEEAVAVDVRGGQGVRDDRGQGGLVVGPVGEAQVAGEAARVEEDRDVVRAGVGDGEVNPVVVV